MLGNVVSKEGEFLVPLDTKKPVLLMLRERQIDWKEN